ncbi:coiled-coil-helix-coiled-coil-helix domain-containing protein 7-like [Artemia franciscana]|uniref:coiled-coil-helix-coiled-coil-helix domain-containing protein 7-like n=1 Tax=Artemia franciscana TaxID=6661 RepID=UPI0032DA51F8
MSKRVRTKDQEINNPCLKESNMSYKCLKENGYDRDLCEKYFANYAACKTFWGKVTTDRRNKGIHPFLPPPEEREKVKEEYLSKT